MLTIPEQTAERLATILALANTPGYLYRHMRDDQYVRSLAQIEATDLADYITSVDANEDRTLSDAACAYAAAVALSYAPPSHIDVALEGRTFRALRWVNEVVAYGRNQYPTIQVNHLLTPRPRATLGHNDTSRAATSTLLPPTQRELSQ
jgi:hypothetical protein